MAEGRRRGRVRPLLIVMLKEPVMGRVKTRLAREIGLLAATRFARNCARSVIARLSRDARWETVLAIAPDMAAASPVWPRHCRRIGQGRGDLGARMARLLASAQGPAHGASLYGERPALLIGADIPAVSAAHIAEAFRLLGRNEAVLGPAEDGGYWLIGLNSYAPQRTPFAGVRWSTPHALADTVASLGPIRIGYAARLGDVDDAASHRRFANLAGRVILPASSRAAR